MTGTAVQAARRCRGAGGQHPLTWGNLGQESRPEKRGGGELRGTGLLELVGVERKHENDFLKFSQCSYREFGHLIHVPFECAPHTRHIRMLLITYHSWRLSWEMHIPNDIIVSGFQMNQVSNVCPWPSCPTSARPDVPPESLGTRPPQTALDTCWLSFQGSMFLSGTMSRWVNTHTKPKGEGPRQAASTLPTLLDGEAAPRLQVGWPSQSEMETGDTGGQVLASLLKGQHQKKHVDSTLSTLMTSLKADPENFR